MAKNKRYSPIRPEKIEEGKKRLRDSQCLDGTADQKLTFLFADKKKLLEGYSFLEMCLILHEDKAEPDEEDGKERPNILGYFQTRQELKDYRKKNNLDGVIIYCLTDPATGMVLYFNIPTLELLEKIEKANEKIIKGIRRNMKNAKKFLKLPAEIRRQTSKNLQNKLRQEIILKIHKEQAEKRKKEMTQEIYA